MNISTEELILKRQFADFAHRRPDLSLPSFRFTSPTLILKRALWRLLHLVLGIKELHSSVLAFLKLLVKKYQRYYDQVSEELLRATEAIYPSLRRPELVELNKLLEDFLALHRYDQAKRLSISLVKLKFYYFVRLSQPTSREDISYLQGLIYKTNYINHPKFHFLSIRFQASVSKYFGDEKIEAPSGLLQEYIARGSDLRFLRVYLKVLKAAARDFEAIFLIQNLLMEFEGTDECYYYAKQCLKLCRKTGVDVPDVFWKNFLLFYRKSKTICELLLEFYQKDKSALGEHIALVAENLESVLLNARGTKKIWAFVEKSAIRGKNTELIDEAKLKNVVRFQMRIFVEKIMARAIEEFDVFVMKKLSKIAEKIEMMAEKKFFESAVKKYQILK